MERKVLVIGLDGGTWSIFDRFMEVGVMPNSEGLWKPLMLPWVLSSEQEKIAGWGVA